MILANWLCLLLVGLISLIIGLAINKLELIDRKFLISFLE